MVSWTRSSAWVGSPVSRSATRYSASRCGQRLGVERTPGGGRLGHGKNVMDPLHFSGTDSVPTPAAVPALLPLSLLEAIRNLDTPVEDGLDELAEEIVVRRLGLSPTVAAQIQRYRTDRRAGRHRRARRGGARAPAGGPAAGRAAGLRRRRPPRGPLRRPRPRPVGPDARADVAAADRAPGRAPRRGAGWRAQVFDGELRAPGARAAEVRMADPLSILALPDGAACAFYGAAYGELLRGAHRLRGRHAARALPLARRRGLRLAQRRRPRSTSDSRPGASSARRWPQAGVDGWLLFDFHGLNPVADAGPRARRAQHPPAVRAAAAGGRAGRGGAPDRARSGSRAFPAGCCPTPGGRSCTRRWRRSWPGEAARDGDLARGRGALPRPGAVRRGGAAPPARRHHRAVGRAGDPVRRRLAAEPRRRTTARPPRCWRRWRGRTLARAVREGGTGLTETALQARVVAAVEARGLVFDTLPIVGFGPNSANPHYEPHAGTRRDARGRAR